MSSDQSQRTIEILLVAADGTDEEILQTSYKLGTKPVVEVMFNELLARLKARQLFASLIINYSIQDLFASRNFYVKLSTVVDRVELLEDEDGIPDVIIRHSILDFVSLYRALLGAQDQLGRSALRGKIEGDEVLRELLLAGFHDAPSLSSLAVTNGTDKWGYHWYTTHYERFFEAVRNDRIRILEIGVGGTGGAKDGGGSLRMWKQYFPRGLVFGIDVLDKTPIEEQRIRTFQGDQADEQFLAKVIEEIGEPDIIVDDGCHFSGHVVKSFRCLFPVLRDGGIYVVEDTQTSYWPAFGGSEDVNSQETSMGFMKTLIDGLHYEERLDDDERNPSYSDRYITDIHFYHNMVFVHKGLNEEGSIRGEIGKYLDLRVPFEYDESQRRMRQLGSSMEDVENIGRGSSVEGG